MSRGRDALTRGGAVPVVLAVLAGLYLASIGPYWNISPDSATYVGAARSLAAGQGFGDTPFHPPVTALVFTAAALVSPTGYFAFNALNTLVLLAGMAVAVAVIARRFGRPRALVCVLLALAYRQTYHESTQLLSEPTYVLLSFLALLVLDDKGSEHRRSTSGARDIGAALLLIGVAMTRTVGLTLALSVILVEGASMLDRRRAPRLALVAGAIAALVAVGVWEVYTATWGTPTKFEMFLLRDPWSSSSGILSAGEVASRVLQNAKTVAAAGSVLFNVVSTGTAWLDLLLGMAAALLLFAALTVALVRCRGLLEVYTALYTAVILAHVLIGGFDPFRHLVPVMPLLFLFVIELVAVVARRWARGWVGASWRLAGVTFVAGYVAVGIRVAAEGVRAEHSSPFPGYPIKRPSNYDLQRAAMMLRDLSAEGERYASPQPDMFDVLTGREGHAVPAAARRSSAAFQDWIDDQRIAYVIVDLKAKEDADTLLRLLRAGGRFAPVVELPQAGLFRVRGPAPQVQATIRR
jgi:hypothetical protein